ncbi:uncharacterized protein [Clytia hemisphaerica]|uniref:Uncharacterized protein n=1 Tax=Clytia hemisphaerica TaxID=252671 RepID=A0A7M5UID8_9CNID
MGSSSFLKLRMRTKSLKVQGMFVKDARFIFLFIVLFLDAIKCHLYQKYLIPSQSYTKEEEVFRTKSQTECLLRCGKRKCMNTIIEDENCQCTTTDCLANRAASNETTSMVECYESPLLPVTAGPICYKGRNNQYASFTIPHKGKVKDIKLQHVSGGIECSEDIGSSGASYWGCHHYVFTSTDILTLITNNQNIPVFPPISQGVIKFTIPGTHIDSDEIVFTPSSPVAVQKGEEFRIWNTEDLYDSADGDNPGTHCVHVLVKFC